MVCEKEGSARARKGRSTEEEKGNVELTERTDRLTDARSAERKKKRVSVLEIRRELLARKKREKSSRRGSGKRELCRQVD